jgi:hypothetical protein
MWILLTKGQKTWVDDIDSDLANYKWYYHINHKGGTGYAARMIGGRKHKKVLFMHNVIADRMGLIHSRKDTIDHRDRNKLNNSRSNLQISNSSLQEVNKGLTKQNSTGYKGVSFHTGTQKYRAVITVNGKQIHIGEFKTPQEAALAYNLKALEIWGLRAWLNLI